MKSPTSLDTLSCGRGLAQQSIAWLLHVAKSQERGDQWVGQVSGPVGRSQAARTS